jgi:hypothetical protein
LALGGGTSILSLHGRPLGTLGRFGRERRAAVGERSCRRAAGKRKDLAIEMRLVHEPELRREPSKITERRGSRRKHPLHPDNALEPLRSVADGRDHAPLQLARGESNVVGGLLDPTGRSGDEPRKSFEHSRVGVGRRRQFRQRHEARHARGLPIVFVEPLRESSPSLAQDVGGRDGEIRER